MGLLQPVIDGGKLILKIRGFVPRRRYDILMGNCWKFMFIVL
ncbi:unnamed protein product, partial [Rotaria sp. Silwood1]